MGNKPSCFTLPPKRRKTHHPARLHGRIKRFSVSQPANVRRICFCAN